MPKGPLLVIIQDMLTELVNKGEITDRYYNPGDLFDEVHILMINNDRPDPAAIQRMVGKARLHLHNLPTGKQHFMKTLGWRPALLGPWMAPVLDMARRVKPALIRCHGAHLNTMIARQIRRELGTPYVVSLHINPDADIHTAYADWKEWLLGTASRTLEGVGLRGADLVLPVYKPILPYLKRLGVTQVEVAYNVLNPTHLKKKDDYTLHDPVRWLSVGRQFQEKNPENVIKALAHFPGAHLTMVGNGTHHHHLRRVAGETGVKNRVTFHPAIPNDELCASLPDYDIFVTHTQYWEISKSVLEPLLTGLPVVLNHRVGEPVPEFLEGDFLRLVDNTVEGYKNELGRLMDNHEEREALGRRAYAHAQAHWAPAVCEAHYVEIYQRVMAQAGTA